MAKVNIKFEKITPFGGLFHVRRLFSRYVGPVIDNVLGLRCTSFGYQYSEIFGSLSSVYFCGGDCVEDVTSHLMPHLSLDPALRTCSSDTILRGISELATANTTYTSDTGKSYDFNTAPKLNSLLVKALTSTGQLVAGESYDMDFDHQFLTKVARELGDKNWIPIHADVFKFIQRTSEHYDIIFADPPYALDNLADIPRLVFEADILAPDGILILEHGKDYSFTDAPHFMDHRSYGSVNFSFFSLEQQ